MEHTPKKVAVNRFGMVATASSVATAAGVEMLKAGGNAVDAAVAAAFCLGVSEPQASGLGGQSMVLLHLADKRKTIALDGSSRAPFAITPARKQKQPPKVGLGASTVPSTPATLGYLLETYGRLSLKTVLSPAIDAATQGVRVTPLHHKLIRREQKQLLQDPLASTLFFEAGRPLSSGATLRQPELAECLELLSKFGWRAFYTGEVASAIVADMQQRDGIISLVDLAQIPIPIERPVLEGRYRKHRLVTFPPPGAGRALIEIMNILDSFSPEEVCLASPSAYVILTHVFMQALRDRDDRPADADTYAQTRNKRMLNRRHAEKVVERIRAITGITPRELPMPPTGGETTHLSVADEAGNAVGITQSIELVFGSKRQNPKYGFFYNNYLTTFDYKDITHPYYLLPGASPWSSVAPTILFKKGRPWLVLGSPGSERIATSIAQVITRVVDSKLSLEEAVSAPRLHSNKSGAVQLEKKRFDSETISALEEEGFSLTKRGAFSFYLGCIQAVQMPLKTHETFVGVADPRRDGSAEGPESLP